MVVVDWPKGVKLDKVYFGLGKLTRNWLNQRRDENKICSKF